MKNLTKNQIGKLHLLYATSDYVHGNTCQAFARRGLVRWGPSGRVLVTPLGVELLKSHGYNTLPACS